MLSLGKSMGNGNFGGRYHYIGDSLTMGWAMEVSSM
jgi:hypothetical protein